MTTREPTERMAAAKTSTAGRGTERPVKALERTTTAYGIAAVVSDKPLPPLRSAKGRDMVARHPLIPSGKRCSPHTAVENGRGSVSCRRRVERCCM